MASPGVFPWKTDLFPVSPLLSVCLSVGLPLSVSISVYLSVSLSVTNTQCQFNRST